MSSIMNNLLDVRKMEEGKMTLNNHPTDVHKVLTNVRDMLMPSVKLGVVLSFALAPNTPRWILADSHR